MLLGVRVVRMHLNGKFFFGENKFYEKRDARKAAQASSRPLLGQFGPNLTESAAGKFAGGKLTFISREPRLARRLGFLRSFGKQRGKIAGAPDARQENRGEPRRGPPRAV